MIVDNLSQLECAKKGIITPLVKNISVREGIPARQLCRYISEGKVVIPLNKTHKISKPCAIGKGLSTKVNANIGTSTDNSSIAKELRKLRVAIDCGADTVMDLSVGNDIGKMLSSVLLNSAVPVGTVPVYEIAVSAQREKGDFLSFGQVDMLNILESQAKLERIFHHSLRSYP